LASFKFLCVEPAVAPRCRLWHYDGSTGREGKGSGVMSVAVWSTAHLAVARWNVAERLFIFLDQSLLHCLAVIAFMPLDFEALVGTDSLQVVVPEGSREWMVALAGWQINVLNISYPTLNASFTDIQNAVWVHSASTSDWLWHAIRQRRTHPIHA